MKPICFAALPAFSQQMAQEITDWAKNRKPATKS